MRRGARIAFTIFHISIYESEEKAIAFPWPRADDVDDGGAATPGSLTT